MGAVGPRFIEGPTFMALGGGAKPTFICSSPLVDQRGMKMADRVGQQFGDYRLTRFLGRGSFGDVYLGEHVHDNTLAAIKVLQARLTPKTSKSSSMRSARPF